MVPTRFDKYLKEKKKKEYSKTHLQRTSYPRNKLKCLPVEHLQHFILFIHLFLLPDYRDTCYILFTFVFPRGLERALSGIQEVLNKHLITVSSLFTQHLVCTQWLFVEWTDKGQRETSRNSSALHGFRPPPKSTQCWQLWQAWPSHRQLKMTPSCL